VVHEADQPGGVLQARHVNIAIHPIDALDLKRDVLAEHGGDTAG
jgi:hypothetical protein